MEAIIDGGPQAIFGQKCIISRHKVGPIFLESSLSLVFENDGGPFRKSSFICVLGSFIGYYSCLIETEKYEIGNLKCLYLENYCSYDNKIGMKYVP